eukprot:9750-Rhodomonas_salina.1
MAGAFFSAPSGVILLALLARVTEAFLTSTPHPQCRYSQLGSARCLQGSSGWTQPPALRTQRVVHLPQLRMAAESAVTNADQATKGGENVVLWTRVPQADDLSKTYDGIKSQFEGPSTCLSPAIEAGLKRQGCKRAILFLATDRLDAVLCFVNSATDFVGPVERRARRLDRRQRLRQVNAHEGAILPIILCIGRAISCSDVDYDSRCWLAKSLPTPVFFLPIFLFFLFFLFSLFFLFFLFSPPSSLFSLSSSTPSADPAADCAPLPLPLLLSRENTHLWSAASEGHSHSLRRAGQDAFSPLAGSSPPRLCACVR